MTTDFRTYRPSTHGRCALFALVLLTVLVTVLVVRPATAQQPLMGPSLSLEDPHALFANPALISFQRARLVVGAKAYHLGFGDAGGVPLRQGAFALTSPFLIGDRFGGGALVQYFDSPIFQRVSMGASVSARLFRFLSVGANVSAYNLSYDRARFVEFDPADPVFADGYGRTVLNLSLGAFAQPMPALSLSLGVRNLNNPDLSLIGDGVRLGAEPYLGAGYAVGPFRALVELVSTSYGAETRWGVEAVSLAGSYLRFSSDAAFEQPRVEGLLHVGGPLSVSYGYELPLGALSGATSGSHTFSVVYEFGRMPDLPEPVATPTFLYTTELPPLDPVLRPRVYMSATSDHLRYVEQVIVRQIDDDVPRAALQRLTASDLGVIDSLEALPPAAERGARVTSPNGQVTMSGTYSAQYQTSLRAAGRAVGGDSAHVLSVITPDDGMMRASGVRNRLVAQGIPADRVELVVVPEQRGRRAGPADLVPEERKVVLDPVQTTLFFVDSYQEGPARAWEMRVEDADGRVVKAFAGTGELPDRITWDWLDESGKIIEPGIYTYRLYWEDQQGVRQQSNRRKLYVQKYLRKVTVRVTTESDPLGEEADQIELRIQH